MKETLVEDKDEIEKLQEKVMKLMSLNKYLLSEMEKRKKMKNLEKEASADLVQLIQKSDNPINSMQKKVLKVQEIVKDKIQQKDSELQNQQKILQKNLDLLVGKIQKVEKALKELSQDSALMNGETKKNYETDQLQVEENIQNDGITYVNNVVTEELDLGNLKLDVEKVLFNNPDSEIIVGSNILSLGEMVKNMDLMDKLNSRCGATMDKCIIYNEKVFEKQMANENRIIDGVKFLRKETLKMSKDKLRK